MKKKIYIFLILFVAITVGLVVFQLVVKYSTPPPPPRIERFGVQTAKPEYVQMVDEREFIGNLLANTSFDLASKVGGRLIQLNYSLGDSIQAASKIALIDDIDFIHALEQAKANYQMTKAQILEAKITMEQAQREFDRTKLLNKSKVYSDLQLEQSETTLEAAKAVLAMREAELLRLQAELNNAQTQLAETEICAEWPDGTYYVGERYVDEGTLLTANQPIINVIDIETLVAKFEVVEKDYPRIKLNDTVQITTDAYPDEIFEGKISQISKLLDANTRQAEVRVDIDNKNLKLKPGMFVRLNLVFSVRDNVQAIPRQSIIIRDGVTGVFLHNAQTSTAEFIAVETGQLDNELIEITSPKLTKDVITLGNQRLNNNSNVVVNNAFSK